MPGGKRGTRKPKVGKVPERDVDHESKDGRPTYGSKTLPRFANAEREEVLERVALLDRRGWSQYDIAREIKVTQPMVCQYVKQIKLRYRERQVAHHGELVEERVDQLLDIVREAWAAWERSKSDRVRSTEEDGLRVERDLVEATGGDVKKVRPLKGREKARAEAEGKRQVVGLAGKDGVSGPDGTGAPRVVMKKIKEIRVREPQCGDPQYLRLVIDCLKEISTLRGLYPVKKIDATVQTIDWSIFADSLPEDGVVPDEVEARIQRALAIGLAEKERREAGGDVIHVEAERREEAT